MQKEEIVNNSNVNTNKKTIINYLLFVLLILGLFFTTELVRLFTPLFDKIYYGNITPTFLNSARAICYIGIIIFVVKFSKKHFKDNMKCYKEEKLSNKKVFLLYVLTIVTIFIVSACLSFKIKIVVDLGENIAGMSVWNNLSLIVVGLIRMPIVIFVIRYITEVICLLTDNKVINHLPIGGLVTLFTIGLFEFFQQDISTLSIVFLFMYLVYGEIYLIANKNYSSSYIICAIIHLL